MNDNLFDSMVLEESGKEQNCLGVFFRYSESAYLSSHFSIEYRRSYRLLKKMSCSGCELCQMIQEDYSACMGANCVFREPREPVNGAIYEAVFVPGGGDWDRYVDEWWWELRKVEKRNEKE